MAASASAGYVSFEVGSGSYQFVLTGNQPATLAGGRKLVTDH